MNRNRAIAQQVGQPERRLARFLSSSRFGRRPVTLDVGRSNRNEPQVNRALDALSPFDVKLRARPRMNVGEALEGQWPLIIDRRDDCRLAHERRNPMVTFQFLSEARGENAELQGEFLFREGDMVLDIKGGCGPYLIVGKANQHWFEGRNSSRKSAAEVDAKWAKVGDRYIGRWDEDGYEFLFSFAAS